MPGAPAAGGTRVIQRMPKHVGILVDPKDASKRYDVLASTDIGRAGSNTIVLAHVTISRQHARIRVDDDQFLLFDLGSANGTYVNDQPVEEPVALQDGDRVRFGEVELIFRQLS
jgi:pSer/pThr/pTyr-binding forkhead associated (FHA) protein